ncbi:hypothetical protein [Spirochaeta cellobiosiphila]|uniref:hypothetical protein n=1 Tax=Spirochaeta cellobiosiphila TaxID=504483 RepID=UPI000406E3DF|nr:hypothetical protein [Spirochaeta cellobiosiphila]
MKPLIFLILVSLFITSCASDSITVWDDYIVTDLEPLPEPKKEPEPEPEPEVIIEPIYANIAIAEVEETNGVQSYLILRAGMEKEGIHKGAKGLIFRDPTEEEPIGTCNIVEVFQGFCRAKITDTSYRIDNTFIIKVQVN